MDLLIFVLALSILVLVHEFGHFIFAIKSGIKVEEFGLGLPPRIWGKKIGGTIYSINWLPLGGFCKLYGEDPPSPEATEGQMSQKKMKGSFYYKSPWQKFIVVIGGVLMNLLLAILVFTTVYLIIGVPVETDRVKIVAVAENSPAMEAGIKEGDWIKSVDGTAISQGHELIELVDDKKGGEISLFVERENMEETIVLEVRENPPENEGRLGVAISNVEMEKIKWYEFYKGIGAGFREAYYWGRIIASGVVGMLSQLFSGSVPKDVSGPLGIYEATSSIKNNQGMLAVIHFFGVVSVNLAVVNILPLPALDGGRLLFIIYEMITKKKAKQSFEAIVNNIGMIFLLGLIFLVTFGDIVRMITR
jgi:regulator of sigma E protease